MHNILPLRPQEHLYHLYLVLSLPSLFISTYFISKVLQLHSIKTHGSRKQRLIWLAASISLQKIGAVRENGALSVTVNRAGSKYFENLSYSRYYGSETATFSWYLESILSFYRKIKLPIRRYKYLHVQNCEILFVQSPPCLFCSAKERLRPIIWPRHCISYWNFQLQTFQYDIISAFFPDVSVLDVPYKWLSPVLPRIMGIWTDCL